MNVVKVIEAADHPSQRGWVGWIQEDFLTSRLWDHSFDGGEGKAGADTLCGESGQEGFQRRAVQSEVKYKSSNFSALAASESTSKTRLKKMAFNEYSSSFNTILQYTTRR